MNTEPMDEWVDYAKRSGLLDENGVAADPSKAQTAWFAFTYAWNRRDAITASEAPAITEQAPPLPEPDAYWYSTWAGWEFCNTRRGRPSVKTVIDLFGPEKVQTYAQQYAAWKIAALRSEQAPAGEAPNCGACPGDGSICKSSCRLADESPPAVPQGWQDIIQCQYQKLEGFDTNQPGWHWRNGWNDALRHIARIFNALSAAPAAPQREHLPQTGTWGEAIEAAAKAAESLMFDSWCMRDRAVHNDACEAVAELIRSLPRPATGLRSGGQS